MTIPKNRQISGIPQLLAGFAAATGEPVHFCDCQRRSATALRKDRHASLEVGCQPRRSDGAALRRIRQPAVLSCQRDQRVVLSAPRPPRSWPSACRPLSHDEAPKLDARSPLMAWRSGASPLGWSQIWSHLLANAANHSEISTSDALLGLPWAQGVAGSNPVAPTKSLRPRTR